MNHRGPYLPNITSSRPLLPILQWQRSPKMQLPAARMFTLAQSHSLHLVHQRSEFVILKICELLKTVVWCFPLGPFPCWLSRRNAPWPINRRGPTMRYCWMVNWMWPILVCHRPQQMQQPWQRWRQCKQKLCRHERPCKWSLVAVQGITYIGKNHGLIIPDHHRLHPPR